LEILSLDNEKKNVGFSFALSSLIRTFDLRSKVLSLDNEKKNSRFSFALSSLIRTFASK